jgi:cytochrome c-type biogenesis protein
VNIPSIVFAFVAGTVASANPCGFALLPGFFLSYAAPSESSAADTRGRVAQALVAGLTMTLAFAFVFGGVGTALTLGASVVMPAMPWVTILVGAGFVALGLAVVSGRRIPLRLPDPVGGAPGGYRGPFLFGVGYAVASLSCTLPIFLAVVGASVGGGGLVAGAAMFLAYAVGMGTILIGLALGAALARAGVQRALRMVVPHTYRISGGFLLAAGLYLIYYWTFFLLPGSERRTTGKGAIDALNGLAERLQSWFSAGGGVWLARLLLGVVVVLGALAVWWILRSRAGRRRSGHRPQPGDEATDHRDTGTPALRPAQEERIGRGTQ